MNNNSNLAKYSSESIKRGLNLAHQVNDYKGEIFNNINTNHRDNSLIELGLECIREKSYEQALEYFNNALDTCNEKSEIYFYSGFLD